MHQIESLRRCFIAIALAMALLAWPAAGDAQLGGLLPPSPTTTTQTVVGDASAARVSILGILGTATTIALADTGTLSGVNDARDASMDTGTVPSVLTGEVLSAGTISWPDEVDSAVAVMSEASQVLGAAGSGTSYIDNLSINGIPVAVTGAPNQTIWVPGGQVIINEQTISSTGTAVVNALHVAITGVADVVIASATAGIS